MPLSMVAIEGDSHQNSHRKAAANFAGVRRSVARDQTRIGWSVRRLRTTASAPARGCTGDRHAPLRTLQHTAHLQSTVEDWGKLLGDVAAVTAMLDRLLHHGQVLKCGPRSWRTNTAPASPSVILKGTVPRSTVSKQWD